jgi:hypothetical protein
LGLAFFGLTSDLAPQVRAALFKQIHEIVFHGKGGYDWNTIYNMPTWLRRFTFNEIQKYYKDEKETLENKGKKGSQTVISSDGQIKTPEFLQKPQNKPPTFNPSANKKPASYK